MSSLYEKLFHRWTTARRFAREAHGPRDVPALFFAGIARLRPFGDESLYARLGRIVAAEISPRLKSANGNRLKVRLTDSIELMVFEEIFLEGIYPLDWVPFEPDTIIDAGACSGMFTVLASARFPSAQLVVVEPEPRNFARIQQNLIANAIRAKCHQAALATRSGELAFRGSGFGGYVDTIACAGSIKVQAKTFSEILGGRIPTSLLLKMDIEGSEEDVLPAILDQLPPRTVIFLETHQPESRCCAYLAPLFAAGFVEKVIRRRAGPTADVEYVERVLMRGGA